MRAVVAADALKIPLRLLLNLRVTVDALDDDGDDDSMKLGA